VNREGEIMKHIIQPEHSLPSEEGEFNALRNSLEYQVVEVPIQRLKPHPRQNDFFSTISEEEVRELALDLQRRGQQEPVHCCPDGTILRGHGRTLAAIMLGWTHIKAVIRTELPDPESSAAVEDLVLDNLMRRQLDDLGLARCYRQLKQSSIAEDDEDAGDLRDRLAVRLRCGKSGRSLDRLERLLDLPRSVQDLFSARKINKAQAEKILKLSCDSQKQLYTALEAGGDLQELLREFKIIKATKRASVTEKVQNILQILRPELAEFERTPEALDLLQVRGGDVIELLERASAVFLNCAKRKRCLQAQDLDALKSKLNRVKHPDKLSGLQR